VAPSPSHLSRGARVGAFAAAMAVGLGGCLISGTAPKQAPAGLTVAPNPLWDTVEAPLKNLVAQLRDAHDAPLTGVTLSVSVLPDSGGAEVSIRDGSGAWVTSADYVTDDVGTATVGVRFGTRAGVGRILLDAPSEGLADTVLYQVLPGNTVVTGVEPADSALYVGNSYQLLCGAIDRLGNVQGQCVSITNDSAAISVSPTGLVTGRAVGRAVFDVTVATGGSTITRTVGVSVVPQGEVAAYEFPSEEQGLVTPFLAASARLVLIRSDGSDYQVLYDQGSQTEVQNSYAEGMQPSWSPDGQTLAFIDHGSLRTIDLQGNISDVLTGDPPVYNEFRPVYSPSGDWIYLTRGVWGGQLTMWAVHPDGTDAHLIGPDTVGSDVSPAPAPDGEHLAYEADLVSLASVLRIVDLSTSAVQALDVPGMYPEWSPDGTWIAFLAGAQGGGIYLQRMHPDGTAVGWIGNAIGALPTFTWVPGTDWLLTSSNVTSFAVELFFVNASTGEVLPVKVNHTLVQPSWKPTP
jgi:Tol biopolymer transport system component